MTECESRSAGSRKGWKCQLVRGHSGPHQNDAWDSLDEWKDPEPPSPSDTTEQVRKLREAAAVAKARDEERKHVDTVVMQRIEILTSCVAELEGRLAKAVTDTIEECCMALCTLCCNPEAVNAEVKPAVLIEGEWWHPVIWLPSGEADRVRSASLLGDQITDRVRCRAAAIRGSVQSLREWYAS